MATLESATWSLVLIMMAIGAGVAVTRLRRQRDEARVESTDRVRELGRADAKLRELATVLLPAVLRGDVEIDTEAGQLDRDECAQILRLVAQEHCELVRQRQSAGEAWVESQRLRSGVTQGVRDAVEAFVRGEPVLVEVAGDDPARELLESVAGELQRAHGARQRFMDSARAGVVEVSRRMQTLAHRIQGAADSLQRDHGLSPEVVGAGMRVDHAAAVAARAAQNVAVLCGEEPGQRWHEPLSLPDVVLAASARIMQFSRVTTEGDPGWSVVADRAEPLIAVVAELLDNACRCSPPTDPVYVRLSMVQQGAVVEIEDCGTGLDGQRLVQAQEIVSGRWPVGLAELGPSPQLGLAVAAELSRRHGFVVELSQALLRGGVRAGVRVPLELLVASRTPLEGKASSAGTAAFHGEIPPPPFVPAPETAPGPAEELPQRRSKRRTAEQLPTPPPAAARSRQQPESPEAARSWMEGYFSVPRLDPGVETNRTDGGRR